MRSPAPVRQPVALTIAGSDSGGGAGIQADLATMAAHDVYGTAAITAVTAQHTRGVERSFVLPTEEVKAQIAAVTGDIAVGAAKTGMLATADVVGAVAEAADGFSFPLVVDPVMVATSGDRLLAPDAERAYRRLLGTATIATPNADEAAVLTDVSVTDRDSAREAGERLLECGVDAALVKGGHVPGDTIEDVLVTEGGVTTFEHPRIDTDATHGSGCTLAAAIAARLARGEDVEAAVAGATAFLERAVRYHYDVGAGPGAVNHGVDARNRAAMAPTAAAVRRIADRLVDVGAGEAGESGRNGWSGGDGPGVTETTDEFTIGTPISPSIGRGNAIGSDTTTDTDTDSDTTTDTDTDTGNESHTDPVSAVIPEGGMIVAGATPTAESITDVAAVDGGVRSTLAGPRRCGDVRFATRHRVSRMLLAAREEAPAVRFAAGCRFDSTVEAALEALDWPIAEGTFEGKKVIEGTHSTDPKSTDETLNGDADPTVRRTGRAAAWWRDAVTMTDLDEPPVVIVDRGAVGRLPLATVLSADANDLVERVRVLGNGVVERNESPGSD